MQSRDGLILIKKFRLKSLFTATMDPLEVSLISTIPLEIGPLRAYFKILRDVFIVVQITAVILILTVLWIRLKKT